MRDGERRRHATAASWRSGTSSSRRATSSSSSPTTRSGRIWYEMRGTRHGAGGAVRVHGPQARRGVRAAARRRTRAIIRVLDPACGSGHFLLYAFDLLARRSTRRPTPIRRARRARRRADARGGLPEPRSAPEGRPRASSSRTISTAWTSTRAARRSPSSRCGCGRSGRSATSASTRSIGR